MKNYSIPPPRKLGGVGLSASIFLPIPLVCHDPPTHAEPTTVSKTYLQQKGFPLQSLMRPPKTPPKIPKIMNKLTLLPIIFSLTTIQAQQPDSLSHYLEVAAENNQSVKAAYHKYEASQQKIRQVGTLENPQLDMGFYVEPMEITSGREIAQFQLMQMFPWFGTRKAARKEARAMSGMAYEEYRITLDQLYADVANEWYSLCLLQQQLNNSRENLKRLEQLEKLALQKLSSGSGGATATQARTAASGNAKQESSPAKGMGGMGGMNMGTATNTTTNTVTAQTSMSSMGSSTGMSEVLRIQMEKVELENEIENILSQQETSKARFNTLLNRPPQSEVQITDTLMQIPFVLDIAEAMELIAAQNPQLKMIKEETASYQAMGDMGKKMAAPMIGVGLQYMLIGKSKMSTMPEMNGKDMFMPMVSLSLPVYWGKSKAIQRESRLLQSAGEAEYSASLGVLQTTLYEAKRQLEEASRKITLYKKQATLAEITYRLVEQEFTSGKSDLSSVIQVQRQLLDFRLKQAEAVAQYNKAVINIRQLISK
ncbi:MAG: TolC family protein [Bacteroidales bacterium]|nr:TolC family protein [Bacteroidales bacterium]